MALIVLEKEGRPVDSSEDAIASLGGLVGTWTTESVHRAYPTTVVRGHATFEWLEGERFLIQRARVDHPEFPDSISILGDTDGLRLHYFDSRGVHRVYRARVTDDGWEYQREFDPAFGFAQRFRATVEDGGDTIAGLSQLSSDGDAWEDDLKITYRRTAA